MKLVSFITAACSLALALPAAAQEAAPLPADMAPSVFDGDYLSVAGGVAYGPSYDGSDDYVVFPLPLLQGSLGGIAINPRPAGLALDFIPGTVNLGIAGRLRQNRASKIEDPVVESLGELESALEIGPSAGLSFGGVLNPYDSLTIGADARWDVNGAHGGMVIDPSVSYFTPLSRGVAGSLSFGAEYGDEDFYDYYYAVSPIGSSASGLAVFDPSGAGFTKAGVNLLLAFDLNGDLADGGLALAVIGSYSTMVGDAKESPIVSVRGSSDQFLGAVAIGYTF
ncbi:MAG: structural protein MipA [Sphingomonadales bacterium 32-68-7]|nr:MAG: structural protein MipA [Sphingomonadales bacterium 12-68-11]OYX09703.1 MAG: structural protein MipA [Sphingomonadales bacterium 32-68-7]